MIKVGITGGIGSGKSLVCLVFSKLGVPVYFSDPAAKKLSESDPEIRAKLKALLGNDIYCGESLNRSRMAALIFHNKLLLEQVNQVIHPKVAEDFLLWCNRNSHHPYVLQESAILFESSAYRLFDKFITVSAPEDLRIQRVISRKDLTHENVRAIMQSQLTDHEKEVRSHFVILNDGIKPVLPQILQIHQELMNNKSFS